MPRRGGGGLGSEPVWAVTTYADPWHHARGEVLGRMDGFFKQDDALLAAARSLAGVHRILAPAGVVEVTAPHGLVAHTLTRGEFARWTPPVLKPARSWFLRWWR